MEKLTDSRGIAEEELDKAYKVLAEVPAERAIAAAIVWAGFKISEEIKKLREQFEPKQPL